MAEREWREASDMRPSRLGLAVVLVAAAMLRFWELGYGVPHTVRPEETSLIERALEMMRGGTLNPGFDGPGHLTTYLQLGVSIVRFLAGAMAGEWRALTEAQAPLFFAWGRALVAALGVATVVLTYRIGMRWGARHALLGAGLLAVLPLHVRYSQVALPDGVLTFFVALTLLLSLRATEHRTQRALVYAGAVAGLAAATRYSGALALVMPLVASWIAAPRGARAKMSLLVIAAAGAAFLLVTPYVILDLPTFLEGFARAAALSRQTPQPELPAALLYLDALQRQFAWQGQRQTIVALAWPALCLLGIGLVMGGIRSWRGPARTSWSVSLAYLGVYCTVLASSRQVDSRYLLPILPILSVVIATAVISGVSLLRRYELPRPVRTALIAALTLAVLGPATLSAVRHAHERSQPSTQELAYAWLISNVPRDAIVVIEASALTIPLAGASYQELSELRLKTMDEFADEGVTYLIAASTAYERYLSAPFMYRDEYRAYTRLFAEAPEVARFAPGPSRPGPELRVLKVLP